MSNKQATSSKRQVCKSQESARSPPDHARAFRRTTCTLHVHYTKCTLHVHYLTTREPSVAGGVDGREPSARVIVQPGHQPSCLSMIDLIRIGEGVVRAQLDTRHTARKHQLESTLHVHHMYTTCTLLYTTGTHAPVGDGS